MLKISGAGSGIKHLDLPKGDPKMRRPDISRAINLLRWEPTTPLEDGLSDTLSYFEELLK
jgi:nucleoside-diphosphate-sugar epimerase